MTNASAAALSLPALSLATFAATSNLTSPVASGVTVMVYSRKEFRPKFETAPLLTSISVSVKPNTISLKRIVAVKAPATGPVTSLVIVAAGFVKSDSTTRSAAASLPLPTASAAASAATLMVTAPLSEGAIRAV